MATHTAEPAAAGAGAVEHLTLDDRVWLLRAMLMMRGLEERAMTLYRQGKVPGSFYDGYGQEAVSAGAGFAMGPEDRLCVLHRDLAAHLIRGVSAARILGQYLGRDTGITHGADILTRPPYRQIPAIDEDCGRNLHIVERGGIQRRSIMARHRKPGVAATGFFR